MKKPEKTKVRWQFVDPEGYGRNKGIDEYEKYLPNLNEILEIINKNIKYNWNLYKTTRLVNKVQIAKAISKRIGTK